MKFIGKTEETKKWITGSSKIDWLDGTISIGDINVAGLGSLEQIEPKSLGYHFGHTDCNGKEIYTGHTLRHSVTGEHATYLFETTTKELVIITAHDTYAIAHLPEGELEDYEIVGFIYDEHKAELQEPIDFEAKEFHGSHTDDEIGD